MANIPFSNETKGKIEAVLRRAMDDVSFRELLVQDPSKALENSGLNDDEKQLIGSLKRVKLEEYGVEVRNFRTVLRDNGAKMEP